MYDLDAINKRREYAQALLASRCAIIVSDKVMHALGYDSTRDFFEALGNWGYNSDFGMLPEAADDHVQSYLRAFIRDQFIN